MMLDSDSGMKKPKRRFNIFFLVVLVVICFAFLATVTWWSAVGSLFRVTQAPAIVGRVAEEATNRFTETVKDKAKEKVKEKVDNFKEKFLK